MINDLLSGCGTLVYPRVYLTVIGVSLSLFLAMYFGNAFSILGVIIILIIGGLVIIKQNEKLKRSQQQTIMYRIVSIFVKDENRNLKTRIEQQKRELEKERQRSRQREEEERQREKERKGEKERQGQKQWTRCCVM